MQFFLVACFWVAVASPRASAADPRSLRLFRDKVPWAGGRGGERVPPENVVGLAAVEPASVRLAREPARINPGRAEDQHAERNEPQVQKIKPRAQRIPQGERHQDETWGEFFGFWWDTLWGRFWSILFSLVLQLFLMILVAIFYKHKIMVPDSKFMLNENKDEYSQREDFSSSLFACHEDPAICFWSCCCPAIRWGDTVSKMNWMGFWQGFFFFLLMTILVQVFTLSGLSLFIWLFFSWVLTHFRGKFRRDFEFTDESAPCHDMLAYFCCQCCAIAQEARHIKANMRYDLPA